MKAKLFFSANSYLSMMEVEKKPPYPWQAYLSSKCKIGEKVGLEFSLGLDHGRQVVHEVELGLNGRV